MRNGATYILFALMVLSLARGAGQSAVPSSQPKRILLVSSYGLETPAAGPFIQTYRSELEKAWPNQVELHVDTLETYRFQAGKQEHIVLDYLQKKYASLRPDVVAVLYDTALEFQLKYREDLFPGVPIVYYKTSRPPTGSSPPALTGIWEGLTIKSTVDLARKLQPSLRKIFLIEGKLSNDGMLEAEAREQLKGYDKNLSIDYLIDRPIDELVPIVSSLPKDSAILVFRQAIGTRGKSITPFESSKQIAQAANVPVYAMGPGWIGLGFVGGDVVNTADAAAAFANLTVRVGNGERPDNISPIEMPSTITVDWRQLRRWGISERALPPDSVVLFKEYTFWELYKWRILVFGALLLLQTLLIAGLLVERAKRSKATHGLAESEERYRNVVQTQTELICRYLPDTTLTFVNDAYCRYFGKTRAELIGTRFVELIPEHARPDVLSHVQTLVENPRLEDNEHEVILRDGSIRWQQWIDHVIINGNGRVKELQGIGRDTTERKLAERALQTSEQRFAKAFSANPQPMSITTFEDGRFIDVNESFLQMSGYERREVVDRTSLELGIYETPEDREKLVGPLRANRSVRNLELKFRAKGGGYRILLSSAELILLGGQQCILVASSDITDRKRLEVERLQAENELSQLTARLFSLQDEERRRIARELHDGTAQNLFAISIDIDLMRKQTGNGESELKPLLDESASLCEQALQEIRTLSYLLHPPLLDQAGLASALKWYVEGFTKRTGIDIDVVALAGVGRMPSEIETALFRIVQESLTNIRRHSGSETASIRLRRNHGEILLEIEDHGLGMNVSEHFGPTTNPELGVGIPGMRQRLRQLGGRLDIATGASGTIVTASIPLAETPATDYTN